MRGFWRWLIAILLLITPNLPAAQQTFENPNAILIQDNTTGLPYPSVVSVSGVVGVVEKVTVTISGFTHSSAEDVDILLVGPAGQSVILLSDAGSVQGPNMTTNVTLRIDDYAPVQLREFGELTPGTFRATDYPPNDNFGPNAPAGPYANALDVFKETDPNGTWQLYVIDDQGGGSGFISGWSLTITSHSQCFANSNAIVVPQNAQLSMPYPSDINVANVAGSITKVTVTLVNLEHSRPADLDLLLVGPTGESVVLMSDAGDAAGVTKLKMIFDDSAIAVPPANAALTSGRFRPVNHPGPDLFPPPAPSGPYGATLSVFNGKSANGTWSLYVVDDSPVSHTGQIAGAWKLAISTEPLAIVEQPASFNILPGTNVTLYVSVAGIEPITYQWRLNGVDLPGASNSSLHIPNLRVQDAGSYSVFIINPFNVIESEKALLLLDYPLNAAPDPFAQRQALQGRSGISMGTNFFSGKETREPFHAGKHGGRSVWYRWTPDVNGIATFDTRGSTFDTLLGVYRGTSLSNLTLVARDEDRGGFFTSRLSFNALAQQEYAIALDGVGAKEGTFVLNWDLEVTQEVLPVVTNHPLSLTLTHGATATFSVDAEKATDLTYEWLLNGMAIPGATNKILRRVGVQPTDVGAYAVLVKNAAGRSVLSEYAVLELGPNPFLQTAIKFEDISFPRTDWSGHTNSTASWVAPSVGESRFSQDTFNADGLGGPAAADCSVVFSRSKYVEFRPREHGEFEIDTSGSAIDTKLALYGLHDHTILGPEHACSRSRREADGIARIRFRGAPGSNYLAVVDGLGGEVGRIRLNWSYNMRLSIAHVPAAQQAVLSWCTTNRTAYQLESTTALSTGASTVWSDWSPSSALERLTYSRGTNYAYVNLTPPVRFFRLRKL